MDPSNKYLLIATYRLLLRLSGYVPHVKLHPLLIVMAYAPTDQDCTEEDQFYSDLDRVMSNDNRLAMVTEVFNASVSERMKREVGPHRLGRER